MLLDAYDSLAELVKRSDRVGESDSSLAHWESKT